MTLAARHGFLVIEDDPYRELRFAGSKPMPRPLLDHAGHVGDPSRLITLGSFSKVLAPGLRVGYAIAARAVVAELAIVKQAADLHTSTFGQRIVAEVIVRPSFLADHIDALRTRYRTQAEALTDALDRHLGERARFVRPGGGMFVWVEIDGVVDSDALLVRALERGVAFVPGSAFAVVRGPRRGLRLSFATAEPEVLDGAVTALAAAVR
jgi:2-aminoadipate transaminase